MRWILGYLVLVNLIGFVVCCVDKRRAIRHQWRIPERQLFGWAGLGGSAGVYLAMQLVRHKTKHLSFRVFIPLMTAAQAALVLWLWLGAGLGW